MREAMLYQKLADDKVQCNLCAHRCTIAGGNVGVCHVRENVGGVLHTRVYGRTIARHVDPIEKKPLFHFYPGSTAYSVATPGCNFRCRWCQNADISQAPREEHFLLGEEASPEQLVAAARQAGCRSIAYTYTEPTIFFEYSYDTARLGRDVGLANVYVTNGYMTGEMLEKMRPYLDAANVDLKGFRDQIYRRYAGARLQPVLDSLKTMKQLGIWVEVTTLVIPGVNDDLHELRDAAGFIADELGPETPWHISRFTPAYEMVDVPPTSVSMLLHAQEIGQQAGLRYVYVGNVPGEANTSCHTCGHLLVRRRGYLVVAGDIAAGGHCPKCGTLVAGRGMAGAAAG
jgi:pyruvate formate lyase activating enzyme